MSQTFHSRVKLLQDDLTFLQDRLTTLSLEVKDSGESRVSQIELSKEAGTKLKVIKKLLEDPVDWRRFNRIRDEVTQINQEVLEIVQGLAMRRGNADETCCLIVRKFLECISQDELGLTVFTARDLNIPTLARLTRLRFPVRSIWTLPWAAHQFANLKIDSEPELKTFAQDAAAREVHARMPEASDAWRRKAEAAAYRRWQQTMSDALAVYFSGPCYAGSAILLRLSPATPDMEDDSLAAETDRAFVILEVLRQMDENPQDQASPYGPFTRWLEDQWNVMLTEAGGPALPEERRRELADFVKDLIRLADSTVGYAGYPLEAPVVPSQASWTTAQLWSREWENNLSKGKDLEVPRGANRMSDLRDALNAGWLCRSKAEGPEKSNVIASAVLDLCKAIVNPPLRPPDDTAEPSSRPSTRAK
jgi:hypothetical protein